LPIASAFKSEVSLWGLGFLWSFLSSAGQIQASRNRSLWNGSGILKPSLYSILSKLPKKLMCKEEKKTSIFQNRRAR
jgi:hypothetical protein